MFRQLITCTAVAAAMGMSFSAAAQGAAAEYPNKPVRMIVPFPPGGGTDILARVVSNKLTEVSKWTVVPDNRAGAGGTIGIATSVNSPYKTLADIVAAARQHPGKVTYGSPGNGTSIHLSGVLLEKAAGIQLVHVPYKGSNPAMMDALSGNVDLLVSSVPSAIGQIKAGKLRAIAVTSARRSTSLPDTPTLAESGLKGFDVSTWYGLFMPKGTPTAIVTKVNAEVNRLLAMPEVRDAILTQGAEPQSMTVADFDKMFQADFRQSKQIVESSGAKIE
jgi:tripartite-type tricarboxylate transporter receptor subunit TctC